MIGIACRSPQRGCLCAGTVVSGRRGPGDLVLDLFAAEVVEVDRPCVWRLHSFDLFGKIEPATVVAVPGGLGDFVGLMLLGKEVLVAKEVEIRDNGQYGRRNVAPGPKPSDPSSL